MKRKFWFAFTVAMFPIYALVAFIAVLQELWIEFRNGMMGGFDEIHKNQ